MNKQIIEHLFEFWEQVAKHGGFLRNEDGFSTTYPMNNSWPSKIFGLEPKVLDIQKLKKAIDSDLLPNSISIISEQEKEILIDNGFDSSSSLTAMALDTSKRIWPPIDETLFKKVTTESEADIFANIASKAFGYPVLTSTIRNLIEIPSLQLFLGTYEASYVSCGLVFLDEIGVSGLHMIGTLSDFRGLGLGKTMTSLLIEKAIQNKSGQVYLVASKAGERIYSKMGFKAYGTVESFTLNKNHSTLN
jgi:ribosomal protein S18 acetylase RimI-like enzyme